MNKSLKEWLFLGIGFLFNTCIYFTMIGGAISFTYQDGTSRAANFYQILGQNDSEITNTLFSFYLFSFTFALVVLILRLFKIGMNVNRKVEVSFIWLTLITMLVTVVLTALQQFQVDEYAREASSLGVGSILTIVFGVVSIIAFILYLTASKKKD